MIDPSLKKHKILYIGHYKENSGWSKAAQDLILAINSVGMDIICRNIKLTNSNYQIDPMISILEQKNIDNIDVCIQHVLPHHMVGTTKFRKNIAYFVGESSSIKYNGWRINLRHMDEVWVPNEDLRLRLIEDGFGESSVLKVHHAFDLSKYENINSRLNFGEHNYKFKFYYIGEINDRKNLDTIIRCFHSEFLPHEPVALVLKIKQFGSSKDALVQQIQNKCNEIKHQLRLYKDPNQYHREIIITDHFDDSQINILHSSCDCFVGPSHGEGWSIPAFDAMCLGKTPICSNEGGPKEFIDKNNNTTGTLISGTTTICNHSDPAFPNIFTGREYWFTPNEKEIRQAMRFYYENKHLINKSRLQNHINQFSYESVGTKIKDIITHE